MDKRIEYAMNTLINTEIWSTNLYLSLQVYFEGQQLLILASWLSAQAQDNMGKVYQMMNRIYHEGGAVTIHEIRRDIRQWPTPLAALNTLLEHEQYISVRYPNFTYYARIRIHPSILSSRGCTQNGYM